MNFVHDELVVAVPKDSNLSQEAEQVAHLMRAGMHEVVPDIHIEVEWEVVDRWSKDASVKLDDAGCLVSEPPSVATVQVGTDAKGPDVCLGGGLPAMTSLSIAGNTS